MMTKTSLVYICLAISLLGILALFLLSNLIQPVEINTNSTAKENELVKITGRIIKEKSYEDFSVLTLQDSIGNIAVSCNCKGFENKSVEITGKTEIYNNKLQIRAYTIKTK